MAGLKGTWEYSGYSGGFAGFPFTPTQAEGPYIQLGDSKLFIMNGEGSERKCTNYIFMRDATQSSYFTSGILEVSDTSSLLPSPNATQYLLTLSGDTLSLYPVHCNDCFMFSYSRITKQFKSCN